MPTLSERDKALIWHPFTQEKTAADVVPIKRGKGSYLYDEAGNAYLDLVSSWWVNLHGHAHPEIAEALYHQAQELEHVIFAGYTHEPAVSLCEGIAGILPSTLKRFFFSDNGSTAVEVALKMAYQFWGNQGQRKKLFLSFDGGYHGDTVGAMSVGRACGYHDAFETLFFDIKTIPFPDTWQNDDQVQEKEAHSLSVLKAILEQHGNDITAIILEPLVQGASGMRMCRPEFVKAVVDAVREYGILVIFDEVFTGFGRTGTLFALEQVGVVPDFMCLSKGLTGGTMPLGLTVTTEAIFQTFLSHDWQHAFIHGHSYTGNPLACAAGVASLRLLLQPETQDAIQQINQVHRAGLDFLQQELDRVQQARLQGTIAAFDWLPFSVDKEVFKARFLKKGLILRPLGSAVYLLPPYCTTKAELENAYQTIASELRELEKV
jgi:adenosylmethionine---8-amino-7-oxononanoate aminotransferase